MIHVTRLNGEEFILNSDLIERIDAHPDTHILLTDGTRYIVTETPREVVQQTQIFRAGVLAMVEYVTPIALEESDSGLPPTQHSNVVHLPTKDDQ